MELYHFMAKEHAISCIEESRLKVATLENMNDPYEFHVLIDEYTSQEADEYFKNHFNDKLGFWCFSKNLENPVQWAHYADNHRGICLKFEIKDSLLQEITYLDQPKKISTEDENWKEETARMTLYKYQGWAYEEELRIPIDLTKTSPEGKLYFASIIGALKPIAAYTGLRCNLSEEERQSFESRGLSIFPMIQDSSSYSIICA